MPRWILAFILLIPLTAIADHKIRLAVLSYQPDVMLMAKYQPVIDDLENLIDDYSIELFLVDAKALEQGIERHEFDVVLIDPVHYLLYRSAGNMSAALVTMGRMKERSATNLMGGVIFTRREDSHITLENVFQHQVASVALDYLETYIAQIYELYSRGLNSPSADDVQLFNSDEAVVQGILNRQADVGFVRSGVLENMVATGQLSFDNIRVLNEQTLAGYPFKVSTRLYPEWALVALSHIDMNVVKGITAGLLSLPNSISSMEALGISGFVPALDYFPVEQVLKELKIAPYDKTQVSWVAIVKAYALYVILANVIVLILIGASWFTYRQNKKLGAVVDELQLAKTLLSKSYDQLDDLLSSSPAMIYSLAPDTLQLRFISANCKKLYGLTAEEIKALPKWWANSIHDEDVTDVLAAMREWRVKGCQGTLISNYRIHSGTKWLWVEDRVQALFNEEGEISELVGSHLDITDRHKSQQLLELSASVFDNAREGIAITTPEGAIIEVNDAFSRITGYSRTDILGKNPRILSSGRQSREFYEEMWRQILLYGFWEGEVWNKRKDGAIFAQNLTIASVKDVHQKVTHYISLFSDITRQKRNEEQLAHIAYFDALTGLPNRTNLTQSLDHHIAQAQINGHRFVLAFIDLDGFKEVNDTFGHETGDILLVQVSQRMLATLDEGKVVARFGGDEFVILMPLEKGEDLEVSEGALESLLQSLSEPFLVSGIELQISASIGITSYPQANGVEADQLIRQADQAMYQAKIAGRNRLHVFNSSHESILIEQHRLYEEIQLAYDNKEFCLFYQPKINMRTREVIGYEALIRWRHPARGILPPVTFLPTLTNQPLELEIGHWVIKTAVAQIDAWQKLGYGQSVSVNLAGYQLQQPNFLADLESALEGYPESVAHALELEILETSAIEDLAKVAAVINGCKKMGISTSLDDFGTGYSTLSHLKEMSVDMLKIDHSFVRDMINQPDDLAIIKGVIGFADAFHLDVIAEGVETEEHAEYLLGLGCDLGQGYWFSRPMPAEEVLGWYDSWLFNNEESSD
ncbi:EAL domain-containing protein [Rhodanobacter aciditrophus]|uniref:EAL domain-containing protein n=1 Tax=Rhodanobacter aciditrophus TaxID=1623218 RepID=A0ABW4AX42_9GAMM